MSQVGKLAVRVAELAERALESGTFGVGGMLVDRSLRVLHEVTNKVIVDRQVNDPTGHVERQLVDWYFEMTESGGTLPPPSDLIIFSSLDPCMMCTGAILRTGFKALALAMDPGAGVHSGPGYATLPEGLREAARKQLALAGVEGGRRFFGDHSFPVPNLVVAEDVNRRCQAALDKSFERVRELVSNDAGWNNSAELHTLVTDVAGRLRNSGTIVPTSQNESADDMVERLRSMTANGEAALLRAPDGRPIVAHLGALDRSPTRTPILELIRTYSTMRRMTGERGNSPLPHPNKCEVVRLRTHRLNAEAILDLGALGSFLEGPIQGGERNFLQYDTDEPFGEVAEALRQFPPFYTKIVGLRVGRYSGRRNARSE